VFIVNSYYLKNAFITNQLDTITLLESHELLDALGKGAFTYYVHTNVDFEEKKVQVSVYGFFQM
tara:strand:- start:349 stop:540 length:192 start_codon:yes stop_codon:yes gene_type:complete